MGRRRDFLDILSNNSHGTMCASLQSLLKARREGVAPLDGLRKLMYKGQVTCDHKALGGQLGFRPPERPPPQDVLLEEVGLPWELEKSKAVRPAAASSGRQVEALGGW